MNDILGKFVAIVLLVILLCVIPAFYLENLREEAIVTSKKNNIVSIVELILNKGEINYCLYEDIKREDDENYDVRINVIKEELFINNISDIYEIKKKVYTDKSISEDILLENTFKLNKGDCISVELEKSSLSPLDNILKKYLRYEKDVYFAYGGTARNEWN